MTSNLQPLVLVVDDDADTRCAVRELLEEEGYSVEVAVNGRDALLRLLKLPAPALVLLDLMMPVMDGETLLAELATRSDLRSIPIVVTTASMPSESTSTLEVPLLRKPLDAASLLNIVAQYSPRFWDEDEPATEQAPVGEPWDGGSPSGR